MKISLDANIYDKDVILFVLSDYDIDFDIKFNDNQRIITFRKVNTDLINQIKKEINEQQLRKDIAIQNKKIRETIISTALALPEENK